MSGKMEPPSERAAVKVVCEACGRMHVVYAHAQSFRCACGERVKLPPPATGTKEEDKNG